MSICASHELQSTPYLQLHNHDLACEQFADPHSQTHSPWRFVTCSTLTQPLSEGTQRRLRTHMHTCCDSLARYHIAARQRLFTHLRVTVSGQNIRTGSGCRRGGQEYLGGEVAEAAVAVAVLDADDAQAVGDDHALGLVVRGGDALDAGDALECGHAALSPVGDHSAARVPIRLHAEARLLRVPFVSLRAICVALPHALCCVPHRTLHSASATA